LASHARPRRQPVLLRTESRKVGQALSQDLVEFGLSPRTQLFHPRPLTEFHSSPTTRQRGTRYRRFVVEVLVPALFEPS